MKKTKKIRISVYWPDDWKSVVITQKEYQYILQGNSFETFGEGYSYEGEDFSDLWTFEGGKDCNVVVSYGDGGVGYDGPISGCEIEEIE
jgi:diphthamide synthase subunit DPH2